MTTEFNLSDKIDDDFEGRVRIDVRYVKEFIRKEEELLDKVRKKKLSWARFWTKRMQLAGDKLI